MKRLLKKAIKPFMPSYQVVTTSYQVIPGKPITKQLSTHSFEKGASKEAKAFYGKVISSDFTKKLAPVEVQLRVAGITIKKAQYGPFQSFDKKKIA
ncbi:hypothetical protein ACD591_01855 [Rufibacter glacialis]|uniref:Uncharacterized protein n=1 Tax=Rufibacter glacialis TaxID=1259555 RepID=A0A5M8QLJ3_9BACT|nr:hypothetical protein [Rufibacter glacialis]KAA6435636.1 hypothetical protein FOE74_06755 [Rufibacter glacialis]GGK65150.1 hypothetical protein GCM10011405_11470 [Rufibacter glacialis]